MLVRTSRGFVETGNASLARLSRPSHRLGEGVKESVLARPTLQGFGANFPACDRTRPYQGMTVSIGSDSGTETVSRADAYDAVWFAGKVLQRTELGES